MANDIEPNRKLTDQQEKFAQALVRGISQSEAYREAYPKAKSWADTAVWPEASRLAAHPMVSARVAALRAPAVAAAGMTLEGHIAELQRLKGIALGLRKVDVAVRAEELCGKASGFYVTKIESGEPGAFQKLAAENKQRAITAIQDELVRRALLDTTVTDVEPKQ